MTPQTITHLTVSHVIRTYNEERFLGRLLETLESQMDIQPKPEVIVVDSGSSDRTVEIAKSWNVRVITLREEDFDYSKALNLGIAQSTGDVISILSAHAIPCTTDWLALMLFHFREESVVGVFSRQVPWPDANWREIRRIRETFGEECHVYDQVKLKGGVPFSNAASCIRRSLWEEQPFMLPAAEDREWATKAVVNGYRIVYEARVAVFHSHNETVRQTAKRAIDLDRATDIETGRSRTLFLTTRQGLGWAVRDIGEVLRQNTPECGRLKLVRDCLLRSYWYVRDFLRRS